MLNSLNYSKRSFKEEREREREGGGDGRKKTRADHRSNAGRDDDDYSDRVSRQPLLAIWRLRGGGGARRRVWPRFDRVPIGFILGRFTARRRDSLAITHAGISLREINRRDRILNSACQTHVANVVVSQNPSILAGYR